MKYGLHNYCKKCAGDAHKESAARLKLANKLAIANGTFVYPAVKVCYDCKRELSWTEFHKNSGGVDGLDRGCKACAKTRKRVWRSSPEFKKDRAIKTKLRRETDIEYLLGCKLRTRLNTALKNGYKAGSAVRDCGCSMAELREHLESLWKPGMSWSNYGRFGWHIDHIKPLISFRLTDREQFLKAVHYTNLQPLWAFDNHSKNGRILVLTYSELQPKLQETFNELSDTSVRLAAAQNKLNEMELEMIKLKADATENETTHLVIKNGDLVDIRAFSTSKDLKDSTSDLVTKAKMIIDTVKKDVEALIKQRDALRSQYEVTEKLLKASLNNVEDFNGPKGS